MTKSSYDYSEARSEFLYLERQIFNGVSILLVLVLLLSGYMFGFGANTFLLLLLCTVLTLIVAGTLLRNYRFVRHLPLNKLSKTRPIRISWFWVSLELGAFASLLYTLNML